MTVYRGDGWTIIEGRWQDSAPESVDVVISDPPYDERTHRGGRNKKAGIGIKIHDPKSFAPINPIDIAPQLLSRTRRWVICFCSVEMLGFYRLAAEDRYIRGGIWMKPGPQPQLSGDRPAQWGDGIAIMHPEGRKRWNRGGGAARWIHQQVAHEAHETQKPLALMLDLVADFSDPGELVWDPYCGSGTTGVACLRLGRRFLGHEMQPRYAKIAAERLAAEERGLTLRDARAGQQSILDIEGVK